MTMNILTKDRGFKKKKYSFLYFWNLSTWQPYYSFLLSNFTTLQRFLEKSLFAYNKPYKQRRIGFLDSKSKIWLNVNKIVTQMVNN